MKLKNFYVTSVVLLLSRYCYTKEVDTIFNIDDTINETQIMIINCCQNQLPILKNNSCLDGSKPINLNCPNDSIPFLYNSTADDIQVEYDPKNSTFVIWYYEFAIEVQNDKLCKGRKLDDENKLHDIYVICTPIIIDDMDLIDGFGSIVFANLELLSSVTLILTAIVYLTLKELRDLQGICILHFVSNLSLTYIILAFLQFYEYEVMEPDVMCVFTAYLLYFSSLCAFFWLNVSSFNFWKTSVGWNPDKCKILKIYSIVGYGFPTLLLSVNIVAQLIPGNHLKPNFGKYSCWFKENSSRWWYYYLPISILQILNLLYFLDSGRRLWKTYRNHGRELGTLRSLRYRFLLYLKLFLIIGITWTFEILYATVFEKTSSFIAFWIADVINCLQGPIIFLVLVATRKRVIRLLANRGLCGLCHTNNCFPYSSWIRSCKDIETEEQHDVEEVHQEFQHT